MEKSSTLFFIYREASPKTAKKLNSAFLNLFKPLRSIVNSEEMKYNTYHEDGLFKIEIYVEDAPIHHLDCVGAVFRLFSEFHGLRLDIKSPFYPNI